MDLKFSFGGASPDRHDHGDAPSGIPLPFAGAAQIASTSSELDVVVRIDSATGSSLVVAEVITGDGVTYSRAEVAPADLAASDASALARAARSAISRAVAGLEGPLATAITTVQLDFENAARVLAELAPCGAVSEELQSRIGVNAGTPVRLAQ